MADINDADELVPRPYQAQLEEIAVNKNLIIHLPTGSGKTYIAVRVIKRLAYQLEKPWGQGGKRTFYLVNNVPLVEQQKNYINTRCAVTVGQYSSEDKVDFWNHDQWNEELSKKQVLVMTCQILSDMLTSQFIKLEEINLLIIDECHHAVNDHPMRLIMKHLVSCPVEKHPRIIGLTATLLNSNASGVKLHAALRDLEVTFHATIATANNMGEVYLFSTNPQEHFISYKSYILSSKLVELVKQLKNIQSYVYDVQLPNQGKSENILLKRNQKDFTNDPKKIVKGIYNMIEMMITYIKEMGPYGGSLGILAYIILIQRLKRKSVSKKEEQFYKVVLTDLTKVRGNLEKLMEDASGYTKIVKYSSDKIIQLLNILKEYNPKFFNAPKTDQTFNINKNKHNLSAIIFTRERFTAKVLYNLLKEVKESNAEEFEFLKHDFLVGFNINPFNDTREQYYTKKTSLSTLLKFTSRELNCIIATSVIEEGVDIPQCLLVLRYDIPQEYRSYIQSKGRARSQESSYIMLINEDEKQKFLKRYTSFVETEKQLEQLLFGKSDDRMKPSSKEIQNSLYEDDDVPPYITPYGGRLLAVSATSLLCRYCTSLPHDKFTRIKPMWIEEILENDMIVVTIIMPLKSPVQGHIRGTPQNNRKTAKRSAALNACIRLYEEDELDKLTLLPKTYGAVDFEMPNIKACFPNWPTNDDDDDRLPRTGTKKRIRKYKKAFPALLQRPAATKSDFFLVLHIINLEPQFAEPKDSRYKALYDLIKMPAGFGLVTFKPLMKICEFPMFLNLGTVSVSLEVNNAMIPCNDGIFELVKKFHFFIFNDVLNVAKKFLVFDGKENCMFVVPLIKNDQYDIDWDTMQKYDSVRPVEEPSLQEKQSLEVTCKKYKHAVVSPWYRAGISLNRYVVSNVIEYKTAQSMFDEDEANGTFEDYYRSKYNLKIVGKKDQLLLEVVNINTKMNGTLPRRPKSNPNAFTEKQYRMIMSSMGESHLKDSYVEYFIPEFCIRDDFPGVLWYKATMLPTILHRVYMLLVAYELRMQLIEGTKYGQAHLKREKWLPVIEEDKIVLKSLLSHLDAPNTIVSVDRINCPKNETMPKITSMQETIYALQKKKLSKDCPWEEETEPLDIERNLTTVTLLDIECYDDFVNAAMSQKPAADVSSPHATSAAAILPPPLKNKEEISLLSKKPDSRGPELRDVLTAITTINSHDCFNLERVETLGDSFLKFAATLSLFHKFPNLNEGQLTNIKGRLIGNRNLYYAAEKLELGGRLKVEQFTPSKDFLVPGFFAPMFVQEFIEKKKIRPSFLISMEFPKDEILSGNLSPESREMVSKHFKEKTGAIEKEPDGQAQNSMQCYVRSQAVSDKCVADCVEALIGTYLQSGGVLAATKLLEFLKILLPEDDFSKVMYKSVPTPITEKKTNESDIDYMMNRCRNKVETILNYQFKDPSFLLEALSHPSYIRNCYTRSYERLEFLGDAVLDFLVTAYVFERFPRLGPGDLTDLRSALVNNVTFAAYTVKLGLHKFLCCEFNPVLDKAIVNFVEHQIERSHEIVEDVLYLIDEEDCQVAEYVDVPKVLSDIFEALAGAVYLDSGGSLAAVWRVFYGVMQREVHAFAARVPRQPVRVLHECVHACPEFGKPTLTQSEVPRVMVPVKFTKEGKLFEVFGFGGNKSQAKRAAAKLALKVLNVAA